VLDCNPAAAAFDPSLAMLDALFIRYIFGIRCTE
jgi:hypothetical protein